MHQLFKMKVLRYRLKCELEDRKMKLYDLTIEYQENPIGLTVKRPRFSWKLDSDNENTFQNSYQIMITSDNNLIWDSQKVLSDQSVLVEYEGPTLQSEIQYHVQVTVTDNYENVSTIEGHFLTGIFNPDDFTAKMITAEFNQKETSPPIFYQRFKLKGSVKKATIYATSYGIYELNLNGNKIGKDYFTPGWTSYHHRLQYQTYDVTEQLSQENLIEMMIGRGWYAGYFGFEMKEHHYGDQLGAFLQLNVHYEDGTTDSIYTDENWRVKTGQITKSEIYLGETIDTTIEEERNGRVELLEFDKQTLVSQENEPVRITQKLEVVEEFITPKGEHVLDFGQNLTGWVEFTVKGTKGQKLVIEHAETLDKDGNFYNETLRQAISIDEYICNGEFQTFRPHFTFHGFRYVRLTGFEDVTDLSFKACVLHSDMKKTGEFKTSNDKINQLQQNIQWSQRDNFLDIPTDCPQRDERLGWLGDAQVFSWTAAYNYQVAPFFTKWMNDIAVESSLEKGVPHVVPNILDSYSSSAWSDAAVIIPWVVYQNYGDRRILENAWQTMHEWVDYIKNNVGTNGLWQTGFQYGDWLALDKEESADRTGATDKYLIANAYYLYSTQIVYQTADILDKTTEAQYYRELYQTTLVAFQEEYYTKTGRIVSETQTGAILSLYFNLARQQDRERIFQTLITNIENHKNHLATGFVGTPYICHALSENGAHELAATLLMKEDYPSWLYAVNMGATTIWERWNSIKPDGSFDESGMNSLNHYAYGSIGDWLYRKVAGINQTSPGYQTLMIKPHFVKGIDEVEATLETPYGKVSSHWICRDGKITFDICVPSNTTAEIHLPEKQDIIKVGSGKYYYEYETETDLTVQPFSFDSTLGEIMEKPFGFKLLSEMLPEIVDNPMIEFAKGMTLSELIGHAPAAKPLYEELIKQLNVEFQ